MTTLTTYNVAVVGEVDAAKSTFIGCMTKGIKDDGRGLARLEVLSLRHERETGRTSSINTILTKYGSNTVRFLDLAGHERYLGTTMQGLTRYKPDLAILMIAANRDITPMTKEHFKICLGLHIPMIFCISKTDIAPPDVLKNTFAGAKQLTKVRSPKLMHYEVKSQETLAKAIEAFNIGQHSIIPIMKISNVTGDGLDAVKTFLAGLQLEPQDDGLTEYMQSVGMKRLFITYKPYYVKGIGYVVFGVNRGDRISVGDRLWLGPIAGQYHEFTVRSCRTAEDEPTEGLDRDQSGCLAVRFKNLEVTKQMLRRTIVADKPTSTVEITALVFIFTHHSTIQPGYNPYLHCGNAATSARVANIYEDTNEGQPTVDKPLLRTGDRGIIRFTFPTAQFIYPGELVIFRESGTKGVGRVLTVKPY